MSFDYMTTIGEIAEVYDGPHATPKKIESGPYFLSISSLENGKLDLSKSAHVSDEDFVKWTKRVTPQEGDILFSYETRLGEVAMMPSGITACLGRRMGLLRPNRNKVLSEYLLYAYQSPEFQETIRAKTIHGATVDRIALKELPSFPIKVPPLEIQKKIISALRGLDRKVILNAQTNQTLEEMAQTIFKSWFVDFDPVKAKLNGEQPEGMDEATASLFPDKLVESEIGLIPDGWAIKPIKDLCTKVQNGGTPKRNETSYWDDGTIPWLTSGEVRQSIITAVENRITQLGLDKSSAKWVPELSTLVALYGATAGEVSLTSIPLTTNQAVCALMPKKEHQWYNYLQLKNRVAELAGKAVGSAQQNISKGLVESTEVLSVPESLLEAFNSQVENLFRLRICNLNENVELAKLRDTLLPKLLSGEIELGTSEELVEAI
jgi:type I restriction enzyme S subunit